MTHTEIEDALSGYDPAILAEWCVDLNCFRWPDDCPIPVPEGYDEAPRHCLEGTNVDRSTLQKIFWSVLNKLTTAEDRSRAWWRVELGRTDEEWQDWWDSTPAAEEGYVCPSA